LHIGEPTFEVAFDGERLQAVTRTLRAKDGKSFAITVQADASDGVSSPILAGYDQVPEHYLTLLDLAPRGATVLDLGAHIGTFSLFAAASGYEVIAVEASPRNAALLKESVRRNQFNHVRVVQAAVSDHAGELTFFDSGPRGSVANPILTDYRAISVRAVTLDSLRSELGLARVDFIKMDIEGSEVAALLGMPQLLSGDLAPTILYESNGHTLNFFGKTPRDLVSTLQHFGYQCYHFYAGQLFPVDSDELQFECVADCLAAKVVPTRLGEKWKFAAPMALEERIRVAVAQSAIRNPDVRAYIGRTLREADELVLGDSRIVQMLRALKQDPDEDVRESVAWWTGAQEGGHAFS
jgi:FkbM family methyltransferase